jgi:hypothetical protein
MYHAALCITPSQHMLLIHSPWHLACMSALMHSHTGSSRLASRRRSGPLKQQRVVVVVQVGRLTIRSHDRVDLLIRTITSQAGAAGYLHEPREAHHYIRAS